MRLQIYNSPAVVLVGFTKRSEVTPSNLAISSAFFDTFGFTFFVLDSTTCTEWSMTTLDSDSAAAASAVTSKRDIIGNTSDSVSDMLWNTDAFNTFSFVTTIESFISSLNPTMGLTFVD